MTTSCRRITLLLASVAAAGCSNGPAAFKPPTIDADSAAHKALSFYDADRDGRIAAPELAKSPALKQIAHKIDADHEKQLSADEIAPRVRTWKVRGTALVDFKCRVLLNGQPLASAQVVLEPEQFLADSLSPARGETDAHGYATVSIAADLLPNPSVRGVPLGLYTVRITSRTNETLIPPRYHRESELGQEVTDEPSPLAESAIEYRLTTR